MSAERVPTSAPGPLPSPTSSAAEAPVSGDRPGSDRPRSTVPGGPAAGSGSGSGSRAAVVISVDRHGLLREASDTAETLWGYPVPDLIGRCFLDLVPVEDRTCVDDALTALRTSPGGEDREGRPIPAPDPGPALRMPTPAAVPVDRVLIHRIRRADGHLEWTRATYRADEGTGGGARCRVAFRSITHLLNGGHPRTGAPAHRTDPTSPPARQRPDPDRVSAPAQSRSDLAQVHEALTTSRTALTQAQADLAQTRTDLAQAQADLAQARTDLQETTGPPAGDVATDERPNSDALEITELIRANEALASFSAVIAHDLASPLMAMEYLAEELAGELPADTPDRGLDFLTQLRSEIARSSSSIRGTLEFAHAGYHVPGGPVSLTEVLGLVVATLHTELAGVQLTVDTLPTVTGDEVTLAHLFQNLLANAVKFTRSGVAPRIRVFSTVASDGWDIGVADNGTGVATADVDHIFTLFRRGGTDRPGSGIGLAVCARIAAAHRGSLGLQPNPGGGSIFTVHLPAGGSEPEPDVRG
jgi:signal transduction histidine kinase